MGQRTTRQDRQLLEILTLAECLQLIDSTPLGRVGFETAGQPFILPVNHLRDGMRLAFRSAPGAKVDAARRVARVAFEVDGFDAEARTGWSVLGIGPATLADDIMASHLDASDLAPWADGVPRDHWIVIQLGNVTGRRIQMSESADPKDTDPALGDTP